MTREEAIHELMNTHKYFYEDKRLDEAIDMAISALQECGIVRCKDCIHREDGFTCYYMDFAEDDNGFCHHGERRE